MKVWEFYFGQCTSQVDRPDRLPVRHCLVITSLTLASLLNQFYKMIHDEENVLEVVAKMLDLAGRQFNVCGLSAPANITSDDSTGVHTTKTCRRLWFVLWLFSAHFEGLWES